MPIISKMVGDRDWVAMAVAPGESNTHVIDDVKWSRDGKRHVTQVEVVTPICWGPLPKI